MDNSHRVLTSYASPTLFLNSGNWRQIQEALRSQLPLRNVHWKSASRASIRTIQELDITLVNFDTLRDEHTSQIPATLLEKPLLNMYIVHCEDSDVDGYKNTYKKQVKDWHSVVTTRKNQEWLILHIVKPESKAPTGNFFQLKGSVIEKLRADFNADKRDRCVQVSHSTAYENPASWAEAISKIKDGVLSAFDSAVAGREEEVKRSESQRNMPGWNFCTFFILKESLPNSFEGVNLFEEALAQYDELEITFHHVLRERNLSWFGALITPNPKDDSAPLLLITKKPYRDLILANTISVFDLRVYILARQCELLARMGRINEIGRKVGAFLNGFGRRLREVEDELPPFFLESWKYSSALSAVDQCNKWIARYLPEGHNPTTFNASKGELLELARHQLDIIGIKTGHLPVKPPFFTVFQDSTTSTNQVQTSSANKISSEELIAALNDKDRFFDLYVATTNRAIEMYAKGNRRKFALKLHESLAALDVHRSRLASALTTYSSLPAHYAPHMWTSLESFMLSRALDTHALMSKPKDTEWIHILLSYIKTYVDCEGTDMLLHGQDRVDYLSGLLEQLISAAAALEHDLPYPDHPMLSILVSSTARLAESVDGCYLEATVLNHLPCRLSLDRITVSIIGRDAERYKFQAQAATLSPGKTKLDLFCPVVTAGTYLFDHSELHLARLLLQYNHRKSPAIPRVQMRKDIHLVRVPKDLRALDIQLLQPKQVELGRRPALRMRITTGRNRIQKLSVKLTAPNITFTLKGATLDDGQGALEVAEDALELSDLEEDSSFTILVPHSDVSAFHILKATVTAEYTSTAEPDLTRRLCTSRTVVTTLPISVNVEDFFRGKKLLSKFTISTTTHQHVRIADARLTVPEGTDLEGVKIMGSIACHRDIVTVTPSQPANFLFQLESTDGPVRDPLILVVKYRMLREEVESLIHTVVGTAFSNAPQNRAAYRMVVISKLIEALETQASWVELYRVTGQLIVPEVPDSQLPQEIDKVLTDTKELLRCNTHASHSTGTWREIRIPVDIPSMSIVAAVRIQIFPELKADDLPSLYAGQPIPARLTIRTSFHWGFGISDSHEKQFVMRFDIEEMVKDWLVSGQKRGDFVALDGGEYSVSITLVALHHGELMLPRAAIIALPLTGEVTMGSMAIPTTETYQEHGAEKVLVLPRGGRSTFICK
ncbi:hypothetical protein AX16_004233 [Volvariella volvacea WC 439]|nr:hypothetical protein AX16_004233 [Volvariella volvacea WC 439]